MLYLAPMNLSSSKFNATEFYTVHRRNLRGEFLELSMEDKGGELPVVSCMFAEKGSDRCQAPNFRHPISPDTEERVADSGEMAAVARASQGGAKQGPFCRLNRITIAPQRRGKSIATPLSRSMSPCLHVSMSPCLRVSPSPLSSLLTSPSLLKLHLPRIPFHPRWHR
ncbi:hypothetical protein Rcae01_05597 [Novipirellula caenicola]|uniref:N-acetyltransferase domain-containing protein n=1 Tax=Novipirellula caenicola TaxID=1536901 RepID=A0ABP9VYB3_9BACT